MDVLGMALDPGINIAVQQISPTLTLLAVPGVLLDSTPWYLLLIAVLYLGFHPLHGVRLAVLFGITGGLNEAFKLAWHLPRPYWISTDVRIFTSHPSFGFPSGAAMYGAAMYGYIAAVVRRRWVVAVCALLLVTTCVVRIIGSIHFVQDVAGGLIFGFLLLLVFLFAEPRVAAYAAGLSWPARWTGILLLAALPIILVIPPYLALAGWELPASWAATAFQQTGQAIDPAAIRYAWGVAGIILGSLTGYEVLQSRGGWEPPEGLWQKGAVILAGTGSTLAVWWIITTAREACNVPDPLEHALTVVSMAVVLFWLTCCVPMIARRAGFFREAGGA
ncbi:MAG: phosphatase PAP2 family protein [Methanoregula sp.]|jgi:membrane-associated phospholipid phosphatase|nr:phosphatase PAP2 family protein [Methanoregula sp.]